MRTKATNETNKTTYNGEYRLEKSLMCANNSNYSDYLSPTRRIRMEEKLRYAEGLRKQKIARTLYHLKTAEHDTKIERLNSYYAICKKGVRSKKGDRAWSEARVQPDINGRGEKESLQTLPKQKQGKYDRVPTMNENQHVKTERKIATKGLNQREIQSTEGEPIAKTRPRCLGKRKKQGNGKAKTLRLSFNIKGIFLFILLALRIFNINEASAAETKNIWLYEESFYVIRSDSDLHNLKKNAEKIKLKIKKMMGKKLAIDMNQSETILLQKAYGEELLSFTESLEERLRKLESTNIEFRNERGLGELMGELIHVTTGVPGPTQYRQEIEAFAKITSIVDSLTLNQGQISHEIDTIMEIDHKQMEVTQII